VQSPSPACFDRPYRAPIAQPFAIDASLSTRHAEALAALLPILGCGEEAATLAFGAIASTIHKDPVGCAALTHIAQDEERHDDLIMRLRAGLPPPPDQSAILRKARHFHIKLGRGDIPTRLAAIAGLDSAVCVILARLLHRNGALARTPTIHAALSSIHRDEARHVAVSRNLALARADASSLRPIATQARRGLADVLTLAGDSFERLEVDTTVLLCDVRRLPTRLLA
jgi:hypothetical protein